MSITHYNSASRGPVPIASMNYAHAANALEKLRRDDPKGERQSERDALEAHLAAIDAMIEEETDNG